MGNNKINKYARNVAIVAAVILIPNITLAAGNAEQGKGLFAQHCASCHGAAGKGDGPVAAALNPKPADLTNKATIGARTDQQLVDVIAKGGGAVGKSPLMPSFSATLKAQDIQNVVAFIRTLAK